VAVFGSTGYIGRKVTDEMISRGFKVCHCSVPKDLVVCKGLVVCEGIAWDSGVVLPSDSAFSAFAAAFTAGHGDLISCSVPGWCLLPLNCCFVPGNCVAYTVVTVLDTVVQSQSQ
jgi:hypothetical protein